MLVIRARHRSRVTKQWHYLNFVASTSVIVFSSAKSAGACPQWGQTQADNHWPAAVSHWRAACSVMNLIEP